MKKEDTLFTIGEFAALHEINKKTLMWYDEIGLLKPVCIRENGYRYYSYQQSSILETILMLRELNVSLPEIQAFMKVRSADSLKGLLEEKMAEVDQTIAHLRSVRKILSNHRQELELLEEMDLSEICLVEKKSRYLVAVETDAQQSFEKDITKVIEEARKYQLRRLHDASYGSMIPVEHLYQGKFEDYSALYIELPYPVSKKGLHLQPAGTYLRAFCKGSRSCLPDRYREILSYAGQQNLTLHGFAYETGINELVVKEEEEYITQIEIPVLPTGNAGIRNGIIV